MTDREILLQAVLENPEEVTPRIAYADHLRELGVEDWPEFIHVQCRNLDLPWHLQRWIDKRYWDKHEMFDWLQRLLLKKGLNWRSYYSWNSMPITSKAKRVLMAYGPPDDGLALWFLKGFVELIECTWDTWREIEPDVYWRQSRSGLGPPPLSAQPVRTVSITSGPLLTVDRETRPEKIILPCPGSGVEFERAKCQVHLPTGALMGPNQICICDKNEWFSALWPDVAFILSVG